MSLESLKEVGVKKKLENLCIIKVCKREMKEKEGW
jgi:hypothetical protein